MTVRSQFKILLLCSFLLGAVWDTARASNFATAVTTYNAGTGAGLYTQPAAAIGPPARTVDYEFEAAPVVPVYPPFQDETGHIDLVTIGSNGVLVLEFDHAVEDDPANPYGVDFLIFGNALMTIGNSVNWSNGDPSAVTVNGGIAVEQGRVSVSQDNLTWHAFPAAMVSDGFAPTLGYQYDPASADSSLFPGNSWWSIPTDATFPVDPTVNASDLTGWSVAKIARYYRGSAGGNGFDLADLPALPTNPEGRKWFRYVKIAYTGIPDGSPEVDAVADVAPATPYELWRIANFDWLTHDPADERPDADAEGDGWNNYLEFGLNRNPHAAESSAALRMGGITNTPATELIFRYERNPAASSTTFEVQANPDLTDPNGWSAHGVVQESRVQPGPGGSETVEVHVPVTHNQAAVRLHLSEGVSP